MYWAVEGVLCIAIVDLRVALRERPFVEDARLLESTHGTVDIQSDLLRRRPRTHGHVRARYPGRKFNSL
jgi:hypothetical protein